MSTTPSSFPPRSYNYLAFLHSHLVRTGGDPCADGKALMGQCLEQLGSLDNPEQFPPRLLVLLLSPAYTKDKAIQVLAGVYNRLREAGLGNVPLIGSSVGGVMVHDEVHLEGALLVCLASRLVTARIAVETEARSKPAESADSLFGKLLGPEREGYRREDLNPLGNRWLLTFLPGYSPAHDAGSYRAQEIHSEMARRARGRFPIVGGVSSLGDEAGEEPMQFEGQDVFSGAVVGALLECDAPAATSVAHGFQITNQLLQIGELSGDGRTIKSFLGHTRPPAELLRTGDSPILLAQTSAVGRLVTIEAKPSADGGITLQRPVWPHEIFQVMQPDPDKLADVAKTVVEDSFRRSRMENPVGALFIYCRGLHRFQQQLGFDISRAANRVRESIRGGIGVGGLFDGEVGLDHEGKAQFTNWSASAVVFGDEMRERALVQRGFASQVLHGPRLMGAGTLPELVEQCLELVWDTGFPGAMLSLTFHDATGEWIIAQKAKGTKLERIVEATRRELVGNDLLAVVARRGTPEFIPDLSQHPDAQKRDAAKSKAVSHYVIPLRRGDGRTFAMLQIDLGDIRFQSKLGFRQRQLMDSLGDEIAEALGRFIGEQELRMARVLDGALIQCLSLPSEEAALERFLAAAITTIGTGQGHIRLADETRSHLVLKTGVGMYYEAAKKERPELPVLERSPTVRAFLENKVKVFNAAANSTRRATVVREFGDRKELVAAIQSHGSYASIPLHHDDPNLPIGALTVCAENPWFFSEYVVNCLKDLGLRFDFLIQHLRHRVADEAKRTRLEFLQQIGLDLANAAQFKSPCDALHDAIDRVSKALNAAVGAIYLHDEETGMLVLRAQSEWVTGNAWIKAAQYEVGEGWTGGAVYRSQVPLYVPDIATYKRKGQVSSGGKYSVQMFGGESHPEITTAGIGLPLRVGKENIGAAVFYRRWSRRDLSGPGFTTDRQEELRGATDNLSALVHMLQEKELTERREEEQAKRADVLKALVSASHEDVGPLMTAVLVSYKGIQADLYLPVPKKDPAELAWRAGMTRRPGNDECHARSGPQPPDSLVREAAKGKTLGFTRVQLAQLTTEELADPEKRRTVGLVTRACIPLRVPEGNWCGVLDLHWSPNRKNSASRLRCHLPEFLTLLGEQIAETLRRQQLEEESEALRNEAATSDRAARAMGAMLLQSSHRTFNFLQDIRHFPGLIRDATTVDGRNAEIGALENAVAEGIKLIERPRDVVGRIRHSRRQPVQLRKILEQTLDDLGGSKLRQGGLDTRVPAVTDDLIVLADSEMIRIAFFNVIHNAAKACSRSPGELLIRANRVEGNKIRITIEDTGPGMDEAAMKAALTGFFSTHSSLGVGVLISRLLIECSDGEFDLQSQVGKGTTVTITLPQYTEPRK